MIALRRSLPHHLRALSVASLALCLVSPAAAEAPELAFPAPARQTARYQDPATTLGLAIGRWTEAGGVPMRQEDGALDQMAWRIDAEGLATLALMAPLRAQLEEAGWRVIFACASDACGGFDFRYAIPLLPEPEMHVDLGDYRYLAAEKGAEVLSLMVSRSSAAGFVQLTVLSPMPLPPTVQVAPVAAAPLPPVPQAGTLVARLETSGAQVLEDLVFASGAADLVEGDYASLAELASYLATHPDRQVALVGHTDASGSLAANVALSRRRAESVRARLIAYPGVAAAQVIAEGVGFLAPRASNLTPEGRTANRRVEVMLTSTQ